MVADAASTGFWEEAGSFDFIYSEDVFEHVPQKDLSVLVERMASALRPNGLALIRPMVFTGICGGHHLEWFPHTLEQQISRRTEPWEHLRQNRSPANTYLNRLTRRDYVDIFQSHFRILENETMRPNLGEQFMTSQIRAELSQYGDDELFSNSVLFVLEPKLASMVH
jgi:SAM-dependent methyltransferase